MSVHGGVRVIQANEPPFWENYMYCWVILYYWHTLLTFACCKFLFGFKQIRLQQRTIDDWHQHVVCITWLRHTCIGSIPCGLMHFNMVGLVLRDTTRVCQMAANNRASGQSTSEERLLQMFSAEHSWWCYLGLPAMSYCRKYPVLPREGRYIQTYVNIKLWVWRAFA